MDSFETRNDDVMVLNSSDTASVQVLELSSAGPKPISSTSHAPKPGMSGAAVFKPSGIGLHLNSLVKALPVSGVETLESIENAKPSEHRSTACDKGECTELSPQNKRKRSTGSGDGDECKNCTCKKTNCLKQRPIVTSQQAAPCRYCECFASGYYCAETCSCQGCFNIPEYQDKVLAAKTQIISKSTPSSARLKRGCSCKKSMCLKRKLYVVYRLPKNLTTLPRKSNVGCSDGCRCAECKNTFGKKEECGSGKHIAVTEATVDMSEKSFDQELDTLLHSELSIPDQNMTNDVNSQPCTGSGSFSLILSVEDQPDMDFDDILKDLDISALLEEDLDISAMLEEDFIPISQVEVRSPENERASPSQSGIAELRTSSSMTRLAPGRKYVLQAVHSIPPAPCTDPKSTSSPNTNA
ncbi:CRC domain-containing protein TSO1-like [Daucus carota subsp. sativus]|uniref:CRC domain-containing protein TSO1-like n=1 Tax=Daucus carota subsp. sativus TaxID=79200 RepID=UPI0007EFE5E2|nr:PREDICTED: CRC domain-containing protein TSO1-like [Daucus carota subsp. sativus]